MLWFITERMSQNRKTSQTEGETWIWFVLKKKKKGNKVLTSVSLGWIIKAASASLQPQAALQPTVPPFKLFLLRLLSLMPAALPESQTLFKKKKKKEESYSDVSLKSVAEHLTSTCFLWVSSGCASDTPHLLANNFDWQAVSITRVILSYSYNNHKLKNGFYVLFVLLKLGLLN